MTPFMRLRTRSAASGTASPPTGRTGLLAVIVSCLGLIAGCTPMVAGQVAEAGYNMAKSTLGSTASLSSIGADDRQKRLQALLYEVDIGEEVEPLLASLGEAPKEKSGNTHGYTCYEFAGVYSATEAAVIMARDGKVVFYGNSRCNLEMQDANFRTGGKYEKAMAATTAPSSATTVTPDESRPFEPTR